MATADMLEKGYLPKELPSAFTSRTLAALTPGLKGQLGALIEGVRISKCCTFSIPKQRHQRRLIRIPNPLHQIDLCEILSGSWSDLDCHFKLPNQRLSRSTPKTKSGSDRALAPEFDQGELAGERAICSTGARFVLHADISRFYPTVYTHSIPWALHGKTDAKKKQKDMSLLGNIIDRGVRRTMAGQTLGIPIGPDSSLVIAEVVGCAMDRAMTDRMPKLRGIRHVDDYHLYFERTGEAERALETLHSIVHDFELELNPNKISIVELPEPIDPVWVSELKLYHFRPNVRSQQNDLISYFSRAFEYAHSFPDSAVLKYALRRIRGVKVHKENWPLYEAFILKCITADPTAIETAIAIFLAYDVVDYPVDRKSIGRVAQEMLTFHSEFKHGYELTWIMFLCKALNIQIESEVAKRLCAVDDPCAAIMTLDLR